MSKQTDEFEHESIQDVASIVKYLEAITQGFQTGRLLFCAGKKELVLKPQGTLKFAVQAKRKGDRVKFSLNVGWNESLPDAIVGEALEINVPDEDDEE